MRVPIPSRLRVGPHRYQVHAVPVVADAVDALRHQMGEHDAAPAERTLLGRHENGPGMIFVGTQSTLSQQQDTVLHESLHAILTQLGRDSDEYLVWALAPSLLDFMQRNPAVVEYLMQRRFR